jgi:hypothetical protein
MVVRTESLRAQSARHRVDQPTRRERARRATRQAQTLDGIARLPGFRSLAYPEPEQKLAPELKLAMERLGTEVARFPIIVSLFEADFNGSLAERLRATGTEVGRYDLGVAEL